MQGVVARISDFPFNGKTLWSFTLRGDQTFYRLGEKKPSFKEGDSVQFDAEQKGKGVQAKNVVPWVGSQVTVGTSASTVARTVSGPATSNEYWSNRETRDIEVQKRIELQSCRNSAIELVRLLIGSGIEAVKLPAKQADKAQVVEELVAHYTEVFRNENKSGKAGVQETVPEAAEDAITVENKKEVDDNWN